MKHTKHILFLILAACMALSPLLSVPAEAASYWIEEISTGYRYEGAPSSSVFSGSGRYTFKVKLVGGTITDLVQTYPIFGSATEISIPFTYRSYDKGISFGGITVFKTKQDGDWYGNDTFDLILADVGNMTEGIIKTQKVMNTSGNTLNRITRNTVAMFEFLVLDPTAPAGTNVRQVHVQVDGGSFLQEDPNIRVETTSSSYDGANYLSFKITMPKMRYTGIGNVLNFSVFYRTDTTSPAKQLQFSTDWSQCVEANESIDDDYSEDGERLDPITPYIIVESFNYGGTSVTGGEDFELELVLRNTSTQYTLQNIVMSVTPTGVYNLTSSSNTYYLKNLFAGSSTLRSINLRADLTTATDSSETPKANAVEIRFTFQYVANDARMSGSSSETITIPVSFPDRLEFNTNEVPTSMYVGESYGFYIPVINKGRTSAYNVEATISGDVDAPGRSVYIGNVNNGDESSIDFDISFSEPGRKTVEVLVAYEDANMKRQTKSVVFAVDVEEMPRWDPGPIDPGFEFPTEPEPQFKIPGSAKVAGVAACALSAYLTVMRTKAKRSEYLDEDI